MVYMVYGSGCWKSRSQQGLLKSKKKKKKNMGGGVAMHFSESHSNRPFPSCFEPHYESEAKCQVFVMKISFHSYANKTSFRMKSFALSLAFIVRFTATRKCPILKLSLKKCVVTPNFLFECQQPSLSSAFPL